MNSEFLESLSTYFIFCKIKVVVTSIRNNTTSKCRLLGSSYYERSRHPVACEIIGDFIGVITSTQPELGTEIS